MLKLSPTHYKYGAGMDQAEARRADRRARGRPDRGHLRLLPPWDTDDVIIWDNWRVIHCVTGVPEGVSRLGIRTTISGDYNVGRYLDPTLDKNNPPERFDD